MFLGSSPQYSRFSSNCENIPMPYCLLTFPFPGCCSVWIIQFQDCMLNFMAQVSLGLWTENRLCSKVLNCGCNFVKVLDIRRNSRQMLLQLWSQQPQKLWNCCYNRSRVPFSKTLLFGSKSSRLFFSFHFLVQRLAIATSTIIKVTTHHYLCQVVGDFRWKIKFHNYSKHDYKPFNRHRITSSKVSVLSQLFYYNIPNFYFFWLVKYIIFQAYNLIRSDIYF